MSENSNVQTGVVADSSVETIQQLNYVLTQLSSGTKVDEARLKKIIESDTADIIVAKVDGKIVGMATINVIQKLASAKAELEDFVVDSGQRGSGVAGILWEALVEWCKSKGVENLEFTSRSSREAAQRFYAKMGAEIRDTNFFRYKIK
ncbi:hypothetical protein A3F37_03295 [Candidatus Saccharibacteria bacterium RIFCSPHIGHO2_12_FULL_41_12]|nr:MAG: hypothetical protein A3F37_03295 [Candidatus Saccharibacteria bacterium RIFCSPHIGHO2_12_FULL_41_12]